MPAPVTSRTRAKLTRQMEHTTSTPNFTQVAREGFRAGDKEFELDLRENRRGKFVMAKEFANGKCNRIVIPAEGIREFIAKLQDIADAAGV